MTFGSEDMAWEMATYLSLSYKRVIQGIKALPNSLKQINTSTLEMCQENTTRTFIEVSSEYPTSLYLLINGFAQTCRFTREYPVSRDS